MLNVNGLWLFVEPDFLSSLEDDKNTKPDFLKFATIRNSDHTGESFPQTVVFVPNIELAFSPFNEFHHEGDFEIGLNIPKKADIGRIERTLQGHGFQFESGPLGFPPDEGHYVIPRKEGIFTPFHLTYSPGISDYCPPFRSLAFEVPEESVSVTREIIALFGLEETVEFQITAGARNRFVHMRSEIDLDLPEARSLTLSKVTMTFEGHCWNLWRN